MADSFVFYRSFDEACAELTDEQYGKIMRVINNYALNGTIPENLSGIEKIVFTLIKPQIDANNQRKTNGCKGGAPSSNNNAKKTTNGYTEKQPMVITEENEKQPMVDFEDDEKQPMVEFCDTEKQPNVNVNDNVNVNANENVNDNANVNVNEADKPPKNQKKHKFGSYFNILLSDDELFKLSEELGESKALSVIQNFSELKQMHGYTYKNDYLAIKKWGIKAYEERNANRPRDGTKCGMSANDTVTNDMIPEW